MSRVNLTDKFIQSKSRVPVKGRNDFPDALVPGLALRVTETGHRSFVLISRFPSHPKNPTRRLLGNYAPDTNSASRDEETNALLSEGNVLTLERAREKARVWLALIYKGIDPKVDQLRRKAVERRKSQSGFDCVVQSYMSRHKDLAKHVEMQRMFEQEFVKRWGSRPASEILPEEVADAVRSIVDRGAPYQAHLAFAYLRRMYNWAVGTREFGLTSSPLAVLKPKDLIGAKLPRTRVLTDEELRAIWNICGHAIRLVKQGQRVKAEGNFQELGYPYAQVFQLLILTGQRLNEIACMTRNEIDFERELLTIPASRMKSKRLHEVPLCPDAMAIIKTLPRFDGPYLFSTLGGKKPVHGFSSIKERMDEILGFDDWVIHDIRRTVRTQLSTLPVPDMIKELVIAHAQPELHQVYDQHKYRDEKRECLTLWERRLRGIVAPKPPAGVADLAEVRAARSAA